MKQETNVMTVNVDSRLRSSRDSSGLSSSERLCINRLLIYYCAIIILRLRYDRNNLCAASKRNALPIIVKYTLKSNGLDERV